MRVLLVEDDLTASRGIALMLRGQGAIVDETDTGEEGLELVKHYDYDIVVLDLILPDMEGYEVVRRMRGARVETPVLILSGLTRPQAKVKGFGMGGGRLHHQTLRQIRTDRAHPGGDPPQQGL